MVKDRGRLQKPQKLKKLQKFQKPAPRGGAEKVWTRIHLRDWRKFRGFSIEGLAEASGVSSAQISLIENGESAGSPDSLEKLAKALKCTVGEMLDVKPEPGGSMMRLWVADADRPQMEAVAEALSKLTRQ